MSIHAEQVHRRAEMNAYRRHRVRLSIGAEYADRIADDLDKNIDDCERMVVVRYGPPMGGSGSTIVFADMEFSDVTMLPVAYERIGILSGEGGYGVGRVQVRFSFRNMPQSASPEIYQAPNLESASRLAWHYDEKYPEDELMSVSTTVVFLAPGTYLEGGN